MARKDAAWKEAGTFTIREKLTPKEVTKEVGKLPPLRKHNISAEIKRSKGGITVVRATCRQDAACPVEWECSYFHRRLAHAARTVVVLQRCEHAHTGAKDPERNEASHYPRMTKVR